MVLILSQDYLFRFVVAPDMLRYLITISALVDAVTILPGIVEIMLRAATADDAQVVDLNFLRFLRVLRVG